MFRGPRPVAVLLPLAWVLASTSPLWAWFPPDEEVEARPNVHGTILLRAIDILRADGYLRAADLFLRYRRPLLQGMRDADKGKGALEEDRILAALEAKVLAKRPRAAWERIWRERKPDLAEAIDKVVPFGIPIAPFTHFYNPRTGRGLHMRLGTHRGFDLDAVLPMIERLSVIPWEWATLLGPHMASADRIEWDYAMAVDAMRQAAGGVDPSREEPARAARLDLMRESEPVDRALDPGLAAAMVHLGRALHFAGDSTVPQHADDDGSQDPGSRHLSFEARSEEVVAGADFPHASSGALETPGGPGDVVVRGAGEAVRWIREASGDPAAQDRVLRAMIPLAERLTAGLMLRFLRTWKSEERPVLGVHVVEVERLRGHDWTSKEDFGARLTLGGSSFETGVLSGADLVKPQAWLPDAWFHVAVATGAGSTLPGRTGVVVEVFDADGADRNPVDLVPGAAGPALHLQVDAATGEVTGPGITGRIGHPIEVRGDARGRARARAVVLVERFPRPARALVCEDQGLLAGPRSAEPGFDDLGG